MDDLMTRLVERDGAQDWPPLGDPARVRRLAGRRTKARRILATSVAVVLVGAGAAATIAITTGPQGSPPFAPAKHSHPTTRTETDVTPTDGRTDIFGVGVSLPAGWDWAAEDLGVPGEQRACIGPGPIHLDTCPVRLSVVPDPQSRFGHPVDPGEYGLNFFLLECDHGGASVSTEQIVKQDQPAHQWHWRCDDAPPDSPTTDDFATDDGTFVVVAASPSWNADAHRIFEEAALPARLGSG